MLIQISVSAIPFDPHFLESAIKREYLIDVAKQTLDAREYRVILDYFFSGSSGEKIGKIGVFKRRETPDGVGRSWITQIKSRALKKMYWRLFEDARQTCENSETIDLLAGNSI